MIGGTPRILLVRRDNIGDLVCTTPLFNALRQRLPEAYLCALVTRYNQPVVERHPALDRVVAYTKVKHLAPGESAIRSYLDRLRLLLELRREHFDYCVLAAPGYQKRALALARWVGARHVVGFVQPDRAYSRVIDMPVPWRFDPTITETEDVWQLGSVFGITGKPGPLEVAVDPSEVARLAPRLVTLKGRRLVGIHISARKRSQRWPAARFVSLMHRLHDTHGCAFLLLWAPGAADNPHHPGDDDKAAAVRSATGDLPVLPVGTEALQTLIAAISLCDDFICGDGGAMHLAAAMGKPIVCLFGQSSAARWRPWGVPYRLLQKPSHDVADIGVAEVCEAYTSLRQECEHI